MIKKNKDKRGSTAKERGEGSKSNGKESKGLGLFEPKPLSLILLFLHLLV